MYDKKIVLEILQQRPELTPFPRHYPKDKF